MGCAGSRVSPSMVSDWAYGCRSPTASTPRGGGGVGPPHPKGRLKRPGRDRCPGSDCHHGAFMPLSPRKCPGGGAGFGSPARSSPWISAGSRRGDEADDIVLAGLGRSSLDEAATQLRGYAGSVGSDIPPEIRCFPGHCAQGLGHDRQDHRSGEPAFDGGGRRLVVDDLVRLLEGLQPLLALGGRPSM